MPMARIATAGTGSTSSAILARLRNNGVYVALALLVLYNIFFTTNFATAGTILGLLSQATFALLVALGLTLVIGTGGIDLSVGAIMAIASAVIPLYLGYTWPVAVLVALVFCVVAGMLNGFLVAYVGMQPIVATLALFVGGRGFAQVLVNGQLQTIGDPGFLALWRATVLGIPMPVVVAAFVAILVGLLVRRTTFGRYVLAVGGNRTASYLSGHPVRLVLVAVYAISGLLAGLAGTLATARLAAGDPATIGLLIELDAIAAVVIGGTPLSGGRMNVGGTVAGAILMLVISATFVMNNIIPIYAQILKAAIIVLAVYIQQGRREARWQPLRGAHPGSRRTR
jgi:ribose/xylose/arabinose/galactoside ABC-type transport system permease subunit